MAPARSIQCMRRPPSRAASGLASLGNTISAISDCESRTGRGVRLASLMRLFSVGSALLLQIRVQKTLGHLLNAGVFMCPQPCGLRQIEFQFPMRGGKMVAFARIREAKNANRLICCTVATPAIRGGRNHRKAHRIPVALRRRPSTTGGIAEI